MKKDLIVGKCTGAHGVFGDIRFMPLIDDPSCLEAVSAGFLCTDKQEMIREVQIRSWKFAVGKMYLRLEHIDSPEEAKKLSGLFLCVDRAALPALPQGRYYIMDLIGSQVVDESGAVLGQLRELLQTGANDVLLVSRKGKRDLLVPYLHSVVKAVSVEDARITVSLPEGLLEIYEG